MSGIVRSAADVEEVADPGDTVHVTTLVEDPHYAEAMVNRVLRFTPGTSRPRREEQADSYLFVLSGRGAVSVTGTDGRVSTRQLGTGGAALVPAGCAWSADVAAGELVLTQTTVPAPPLPHAELLARSRAQVPSSEEPFAVLGEAEREDATSSRQFEVLFDGSRGSRGATQFVGFIPPSGAPAHYHLYDEICVIVRGSGLLHAAGTSTAISAGSTFHVPPRFLHAIENTGAEDIWILGVFRPAGSAAAAYYPDGEPAPNNAPE